MSQHEHDRERLVAVGEAENGMIAALWQQVLEDEGIRSMIKPTGAGAGYFSTAIQQHVVYVLESDAERARAVLTEVGVVQDAGVGDEDTPDAGLTKADRP